jgi:hypothetical protein
MTREPKSYPLTATFDLKLQFKNRKSGHLEPHGRPLAEKVAGRPRNFDEAAATRMQEALRAFLVDQIIFADGYLPRRKTKLVQDFLQQLVAAENVESGSDVINLRVVRPVYMELLKKAG